MSALNKIYEQQYLKSVGEDDDSKKRKREEAHEYIDEWIEEQYDTRDYKCVSQQGKNNFINAKRDLIQQMESEIPNFVALSNMQKHEERTSEKVKKRVEMELGTQEEYATEYAEEHFAPRVTFGLILSIRDLLKCSEPNVNWSYNSQGVKMITTKEINSGEQLFV